MSESRGDLRGRVISGSQKPNGLAYMRHSRHEGGIRDSGTNGDRIGSSDRWRMELGGWNSWTPPRGAHVLMSYGVRICNTHCVGDRRTYTHAPIQRARTRETKIFGRRYACTHAQTHTRARARAHTHTHTHARTHAHTHGSPDEVCEKEQQRSGD